VRGSRVCRHDEIESEEDGATVKLVYENRGEKLRVARLDLNDRIADAIAKAGGTPMPLAPPERLVVNGFNRYVRNPMYVGLLIAILGQALLFGSLGLVLYAVVVWIITASFVRWYEEPTLSHRYGTEYEEYRRNVPAWLPRWRPWKRARRRPTTLAP